MNTHTLHIILLLAALLSAAAPHSLAGQENEPVELEEWCHIEGADFAWAISYFPNFDTANGGRKAIMISNKGRITTWYLDDGCDTTNHFTWPAMGRSNVQVDLDNDGVLDYVTGYGTVHRGVANGLPPEQDTIARYRRFGTVSPVHVIDINRDGYDDVLTGNQSPLDERLFTVLFGGPDLRKLRLVAVHKPWTGDREENFIGVSKALSMNGKVRIVTQPYEQLDGSLYQEKWVSYRLMEVHVRENENDLSIELITLDSLSDADLRPQQRYENNIGALLKAGKDDPERLIISTAIRKEIQSLSLANDKFTNVQSFAAESDFVWVATLNGSLNGDQFRDWFTNILNRVYFYSGKRHGILDTIPFAALELPCESGAVPNLAVIGDVTGDGIDDFAFAASTGWGCFTIYKGVDRRVVGVSEHEKVQRHFDMRQNYPHPVLQDRKTTVPITCEKSAQYTLELYTVNGKKLALLFDTYLPAGEHKREVDFSSLQLTSGLYVLRLHSEGQMRNRGIIVR